MDEIVNDFMAAFAKDPVTYGRMILTTLELNKLESRLQDLEKPALFKKKIDEFGIVETFTINPSYPDIALPRTRFTEKEYSDLLDWIDEEDEARMIQLAVMLNIGNAEHCIFSAMSSDFQEGPPLFFKKCDDRGFPVSYTLNVESVEQTINERGERVINIRTKR